MVCHDLWFSDLYGSLTNCTTWSDVVWYRLSLSALVFFVFICITML